MNTIARLLDVKERIDQECYFCGATKSAKYILNGAISITGEIIDKEVACCDRCILYHAYSSDRDTTFTTSIVR